VRGARFELAAVIVLLALLASLGAVVGARAQDRDDPRRSSFLDAPRGLHALYMVLDEVGAAPRRAMSPPQSSDPVDHTLVVAEPSAALTRRETEQIVQWVDRGGRIVLVAGPRLDVLLQGHARGLLEAFGISVTDEGADASGPFEVRDQDAAADLRRIEWAAHAGLRVSPDASPPPELRTVVDSAGVCVAGRIARGEKGGEVVVLADAGLLDNQFLGRADNAVLAVRLFTARAGDEGRVVFDEFHHGFADAGTKDHVVGVLLGMLHDTWPGRALLVIALAGLVWLAGAGVRFGSPAPEPPPPRRALSEHADALGRIFEQAAARRETLRILAAGARRVAGARLGMPGTLKGPAFVARLRGLRSPGAADLADAMERAESGREAKDVQMAEAAANLARAKRRFLHGGE
jgi:hypothetical protein